MTFCGKIYFDFSILVSSVCATFRGPKVTFKLPIKNGKSKNFTVLAFQSLWLAVFPLSSVRRQTSVKAPRKQRLLVDMNRPNDLRRKDFSGSEGNAPDLSGGMTTPTQSEGSSLQSSAVSCPILLALNAALLALSSGTNFPPPILAACFPVWCFQRISFVPDGSYAKQARPLSKIWDKVPFPGLDTHWRENGVDDETYVCRAYRYYIFLCWHSWRRFQFTCWLPSESNAAMC